MDALQKSVLDGSRSDRSEQGATKLGGREERGEEKVYVGLLVLLGPFGPISKVVFSFYFSVFGF